MEVLKRLAAISALILFAIPASGEQIAIDQFGYLNNNDPAATLEMKEAQSLLNVDISPNGKSVRKRDGFGVYKAVGGSSAMRGGYHAYDATGNDIQLWGSSTNLYGSVADATFTTLVSSATSGATWDCTDTQGSAYCVNSSRDALIKTNGATITWYTSPLGSMVAISPDRLIVSGVAAAPNSLYFSQSGTFTNFVTGINETDPFVEVIGAPGGKITHVEYACGRVLWWKDQSFGYLLGTDQTNVQIVTVSNSIGTFDNSSAIDPFGNVYFRGQEGHLYKYDCSSIQNLSIPITSNIQASGRRISNLWTQTTQSDFEAGVSTPTANLSYTLSANNISVSSYSAADTTAANFDGGTLNNTNTNQTTDSVQLSVGESQTTHNNAMRVYSANEVSQSFTAPASGNLASITAKFCKAGTPPTDVTISLRNDSANTPGTAICTGTSAASNFPACNGSFSNGSETTTSCTTNLVSGTKYWIKATCATCTDSPDNSYFFSTSNSNVYANGNAYTSGAGHQTDRDGVFRTQFQSTGTFTSRTFDTGFTKSYGGISAYTATLNGGNIAFTVQTAASSGGPWTAVSSTWTTNVVDRYLRYISTFTAGSTNTTPTLADVTLVASSSGTHYSAVKNAPNLVSWDTFTANRQETGGTVSFFMRSSTNTFTTLSSTPSWTAQSVGSVVTVATGTYFQVRSDFGLTAGTHTAILNDFSVFWFEGTASDKAYATYFDNAIWWSLAYGSGQATNNYIFRWDLINEGWGLYNFGTGGMLVQNNNLYFGSAANNTIFRFGDTTSDNGTAIAAHWQSKDFSGPDPWLENELMQLDVITARDPNQSLTVGYTLNASTTATTYSVALSSTTDSVIRHKKNLPSGKIGGLFSVKFSDSSATSSWDLLGFRMKFNPLPYRPTQ